MSVYYEARRSGRLTQRAIVAAGGSARRALRAVKRREADERNARTLDSRRAVYRRALVAELGWAGYVVYLQNRGQR